MPEKCLKMLSLTSELLIYTRDCLKISYDYKSLRLKFIRKEYHERPSIRKLNRLLTTTNDRDLHKLMTFIKLVLKDYNLRLHRH